LSPSLTLLERGNKRGEKKIKKERGEEMNISNHCSPSLTLLKRGNKGGELEIDR